MTTMLVHGWTAAEPAVHCYAIIDADGDDVWQAAAALEPGRYWNQTAPCDGVVPDDLKGKVMTKDEFQQIAQGRLELFRALRRVEEVEAQVTREENGNDHEDIVSWHKTIERIFFTAAVADVVVGHCRVTEGVHSAVESLKAVAELAIERAQRDEWDSETLLDILDDDPTPHLVLQDMPEGLHACARSEFVRARFAAADADMDGDDGDDGDDEGEPETPTAPREPPSTDPKVRAAQLRARFSRTRTVSTPPKPPTAA